ncbi:hypothetical protein EG68_09172 [Paragonimus skrjabini miyazakii]|uniref:OTU domain-containing protein n=1 Tax=Paragonimus skrjabini miyazakii TaxID=59628 RepID=A0A8S9YNL2_9TREM|nr:hypothetical protein EG68_09172 [Paragonimus skrjabini miyazakii]
MRPSNIANATVNKHTSHDENCLFTASRSGAAFCRIFLIFLYRLGFRLLCVPHLNYLLVPETENMLANSSTSDPNDQTCCVTADCERVRENNKQQENEKTGERCQRMPSTILSEKLTLGTSDTTEYVGSKESHKLSRAARRREKRAEQRRAQEEALSKVAASADLSSRGKEWKKIEEQLFSRKLRIYEIPSDGDCLYRSIAHQLIQRKITVPDLQSRYSITDRKPLTLLDDPAHLAQSLRFIASHYLRENRDTFLSFMISSDSGGQMSDDEYNAYCDSVEKPSVWGGQVEMQALANALNLTIEVLQAEGPPIILNGESGHPLITIVYQRHAFALGEHYNSCVPISGVT